MSKQTLWIWPALFGISAAFLVIGITIRLLGAKPALVRQKFKLGSLIILMNAMLAACDGVPAPGGGQAMCYDVSISDGGPDADADTDSDTDTDTDSDTDTDTDSDTDTDTDSDTDTDTDSDTDFIECYDMPAENSMIIDFDNPSPTGTLELDLAENNRLTGKIFERMGSDFSFRIEDLEKNESQSGTLEALDGEFDELSEEFEILVSTSHPSGTYVLLLYATTLDDVKTYNSFPSASYTLKITNGAQ